MTLEIVQKYTMEPAGPLSPLAADALRAVRLGEADAAAQEIYRRTAGWLREKDRWLLCDCREGAVIAFRLHGSGAVSAINLPEADVPHAPGCPFGLRDAGEDADALVGDLFLPDGEPGKPGEGPGDGIERPWTGGRPTGLSQVLKTLMQAAGLNRFDGAAGPAAPGDWQEACRRAAGEMRVAGRVKMSDILFTDPAKWGVDGTAERLDEMARAWPGRGRPFALLSWLAHDVAVGGINTNHPEAGRVEVRSRVELEKPLFPFVVRGGPCLPVAQGPFADRDTARYVIEVMGFADAAYERRKESTHARMRRIGRVIRMEGRQFESPWNDLETQIRGIARRIGKDLVGRWKQA